MQFHCFQGLLSYEDHPYIYVHVSSSVTVVTNAGGIPLSPGPLPDLRV